MKKVGKYLVITLLLLLGLCCVGVLYLFFIPNSTLFNITYLNRTKTVTTDKQTDYVSTINLNSRAYDVKIETTKEDGIYLKLVSKAFGFVKTKNKTADVKATINNGSLTYDVIEPHGLIAKNSSFIVLYIPEDLVVNLKISNKKAKTTIDNSKVEINELTYATEKGNFFFEKGSIQGKLDLNLNDGKFVIGEKVQTANNDVNLGLNKGSFDACESVLGNVEIQKTERGVIKIKECLDLIHNNSKTAGGRIEIGKVEYAFVSTSDTNLSFGEVSAGAAIKLTESGSVDIEKLGAKSDIQTHDGHIYIGNVPNSLLEVTSENGNITVKSASKKVQVLSNNGNVEISFGDETAHYNSTDLYRTLCAEVKNGTLTAYGVEHIGSGIDKGVNVTGTARVNLFMTEVAGQNEIIGGNGNISLTVNHESAFKLSTRTTSGNVRVNLMQIPEYNGYTTKEEWTTFVNTTDTSISDNMKISTTQGNMLVLDTLINTL